MPDEKPEQWNEKIDRLGAKYKLWLVIPLVISGLIALKDLDAGIGAFLFFLLVWAFSWSIGLILGAFGRFLPASLAQDHRRAIAEAAFATLSLVGYAAIGVILRNDNIVSDWLAEELPGGMNLAFIDPVFAVVVLLCIWAYTGYRVSR
ncbi:hypothetical protein [Mesobacterium pallidum]|uniref:hypothetical protein n=1 Tax=Mesobacterium pallidum TaxID=2872037 RepID=UPI001EE1D35B|nr:hypothetical protein [Mesobacterium pallidum]